MIHPLKVIVTGQVQNPSDMVAVNVSVTIPVLGSCEQFPVGTPVTFETLQSGNSSAWFIEQDIGGPELVHAKSIANDPFEYPQTKSQGPLLESVPVMTVVGHPVLHVVFGGIGVDGPAVNWSVEGKGLLPQQGWNDGL